MSAAVPLMNAFHSPSNSQDYGRERTPTNPIHRLIRTSSPSQLWLVIVALLLVGAGFESVRSHWTSSPSAPGAPRLDRSKLAVLLEKRNQPELVPVLLDFVLKVPPEWPFQMWTSQQTFDHLWAQARVRPLLDSRKLTLKILPDNGDNIYDGNSLSSFMAGPWWWEQLAPAEHLLFFQTDSIICGRSEFSLNDFLGTNVSHTHGGYSLLGAVWPWFGYPAEPFGGNGGLSIRRRSVMLDITRNNDRRDGWNEDEFFSHKIKESSKWGIKTFADQHTAMRFSFESAPPGSEEEDWVFQPFGIHIGSGWMSCDKPDHVKKILDHCPESAMLMPRRCIPRD